MIKKNRDEKKDIRNFGIALTVFLSIIGSYRFYHRGQLNDALWFYGIGGVSLFLSFFAPLCPSLRLLCLPCGEDSYCLTGSFPGGRTRQPGRVLRKVSGPGGQ